MIAPAAAAELVPPLRLDGLRAAGLYPDAQTDDARLCLANVRGAADAGAVVLNRVELDGLERGPVAHLRDTSLRRGVRGRSARGRECRRALARRRSAARGRACRHLGDAEQRRTPRARARRRLGRRGHDPDRPDARRLRRPLGRPPAGRDHRRRLRGRRPHDRADRGGGAADPRRGRSCPGGRCARPGSGALRRRPRAAGRIGRDGAGASRDDALVRRRSGWSRSRAGS